MNRNSFVGLNGFIWWVGEVESLADELAVGRMKVRIFGWHTDNEAMLPTEQLPWAHPMVPINVPNIGALGKPKIGEWVMGFFMDGESGQFPIVMGILPGIKTSTGK
jgi:hypothetical protein